MFFSIPPDRYHRFARSFIRSKIGLQEPARQTSTVVPASWATVSRSWHVSPPVQRALALLHMLMSPSVLRHSA